MQNTIGDEGRDALRTGSWVEVFLLHVRDLLFLFRVCASLSLYHVRLGLSCRRQENLLACHCDRHRHRR